MLLIKNSFRNKWKLIYVYEDNSNKISSFMKSIKLSLENS